RRRVGARRERGATRLRRLRRGRQDSLEERPDLGRHRALRAGLRIEQRLDDFARRRWFAELVEPERGDAGAGSTGLVGPERRQPRGQQRDELAVLAARRGAAAGWRAW